MLAAVVGSTLVAGPVPVVGPSPGPAAVPCPYVTIPSIPPTPTAPTRDPGRPVMGGDRLAGTGLVAPAGAPAPPAVSAVSWVIADLDSGAVVAACSPHLQRRP